MPALGPLSISKERFSSSLANSSTFQAMVGAADATAARNRIYNDVVPELDYAKKYTKDELETLRPYAMVSIPDGQGVFRLFRTGRGLTDGYVDNGTVHCQIARDIPPALVDLPEQAEEDFYNVIGQIFVDLVNASNGDGNLDINDISLNWIMLSDPKNRATQGMFQVADFQVGWGLAG